MQAQAVDSLSDKEAEQAVLGAMMTEKSVIPRVIALLGHTSDAFFTTDHQLIYAAILAEQTPVPRLLSEIKKLADKREDSKVFTMIANTVVVHGVPHSDLMRLLLFSALEGHKLSDMFFQNHVRVFHEFLASYIDRRIRDGAFRKVDSLLVARAFMGMLIEHRLLTLLFRLPVSNPPENIVETFVALFLDGLREGASDKPKGKKRRPVKTRTPRMSKLKR